LSSKEIPEAMRPIKIQTGKITSLIVLLLFICLHGYAQSTDLSYGSKRHLYIGLSVKPSQTSIAYRADSISGLTSSKNSSLGFSVDAGYNFSKYLVLSTGIGFSSYGTQLSLDSYEKWYDTTDIDQDSYNRQVTGKNIKELQKFSYLNIPVVLSLQLPVSDRFGFYLQTGINLSIPISKTYSSTGTFSYSGYFPSYTIMVQNVQYEGFLSNNNNSVKGKLEIKTLVPELITSAGFQYFLKERLQVSLGIFYNKILSGISEYSSPETFRLSSKPDQMKSIMAGSTNVSASSIGFRISFRYYLK
jgi:hypothetical protein